MRGDLNETFKIINGITNFDRHFFSVFLIEIEIYSQNRFQKLSLQVSWCLGVKMKTHRQEKLLETNILQ